MRDGWIQTTLGEVAEITMGQSPPGSSYNVEGRGLPFIQGSAEFGNIYPAPVKWCDSPRKVAEAGDLLISVRAPVGDANRARERIAVGRGLAILRGGPSISTDYLWLLIPYSAADLRSRSSAGMFESITAQGLRGLPVTVPPMTAQRRIADLVEIIDDATSSALLVRGASCRTLTALAIECWSAATTGVTLGELGRIVTGTTPPTADRGNWVPPEVPFFTPGDFAGRLVLTHAERGVSRKGASSGRPLPANSVAMVCIGATLGKTAVLDIPCVTNQQINALVGLDDDDALCLAALLASPPGQARAWPLSGRTTLPILNKSGWSSLRVPWPRRAVRQRYASLLRACEAALHTVTVEISALAVLRRAVLDDLLNGQHVIAASYDRFFEAAS